MRSLCPPGLATILLASACSSGTKPAEPPNAAVPSSASAPNAASEAAPAPEVTGAPAGNTVLSYEQGKVEFRYSWPREAAGIADLDAWLRDNGERLKAQMLEGARNEAAAAKESGYEMPGYSYTEDWRPVANIPALLVLQSEGYSYTGGAHGMPVVTTLFWDKVAKKRLATGDIFDMPALTATLKDRFCKALDAEREKRRGEPVDADDPNQLSEFIRCVDLAKQTLLPVSARGGTLDTVRVVIMPYEAGPYAEGIYEIDLPVDAAVLRAVKPAYRGAFSAG